MGLIDLFKDLGSLLNQIQQSAEENKEYHRQGKMIVTPGEESREALYDVRIRVGSLGDLDLRRRETQPQATPCSGDNKEPATDIYDESQKILVVMQVPGASPEGIYLETKGNLLQVKAQCRRNSYYKEIVLPFAVSSKELLQYSLHNEILEIRIPKPSEA
ncbi:MAG: Hsp20/alpha crystallin family protein [Bacillota bacterium]